MPKSIMIFTAGKGTRMLPLTETLPKPMILVNGKPLADYAFALAQDENLQTVMNLHYLPDSIVQHFGPKGVQFSNEKSQLLETGGGLRKALPILQNAPVFTLNSDAIWSGPNPLTLLRKAWNPTQMDALLMLVPLTQSLGHHGSGDFSADQNGQLTRGGALLYTGAQIIKTERLAEISESAFSLNLYWNLLMQSGRVFGVTYSGKWCDVGQPSSVPIAESLLNRAHDV
ncbi:nucleotidyltransferase family protein [Falsihalocynthiibacter arcticus]|uniref:Nucleotidyltransferase n=1 Tax=Falsihalocynthiibacter arcticus TaxID=1579316 RepID=A0A126UXR1_9RHOB|nr:nucleotidyltransferase family protein [Falsihalocynthiibacter arcticus]AML50851.1 nucleotidyltransferase [Falsihalocynthiibacter arcticus]